MSNPGGAILQGDSNTIMPDVWGYLLVKFNLKGVIDIGCGYGHTLKWFQEHGRCNIAGVDGDPDCKEQSVVDKGHIMLHDFTTGPLNYGVPFDLAWSAEFLEHVEEQFIPNFMPTFRLARYAVVTHAEPGQHGTHHVNCQTSEYWADKFAAYGFHHDPEETRLLRQTDRWNACWGRRTLMFFKRIA